MDQRNDRTHEVSETRLAASYRWRVLYPTPLFGVCALSFAGIEVALLGAHDQRLWAFTGFPWHGRVSMAAVVFLTAAALSWLIYWFLCLMARMRLAILPRLAFAAGSGVVISTAFVAYVASWLLMWKTGLFADSDAIIFAARNLAMLCNYLQQTEPLLGSCLFLAGGVAGCLGAFFAFRWTGFHHRLSCAVPWQLKDGGLVIMLWIAMVSLAVLAYEDPSGQVRQTREWWKDQRPGRSLAIGYRVNPVITAAAGCLIVRDDNGAVDLSAQDLGPLRASLPQPVAEKVRPRMSLILIEIESLRHDVVNRQHQTQEVMPMLNRLAASGLTFTRTYAASTHSNYADPSLLSSLYPLRTTHHHYYSPADPWPKCLVYTWQKSAVV